MVKRKILPVVMVAIVSLVIGGAVVAQDKERDIFCAEYTEVYEDGVLVETCEVVGDSSRVRRDGLEVSATMTASQRVRRDEAQCHSAMVEARKLLAVKPASLEMTDLVERQYALESIVLGC